MNDNHTQVSEKLPFEAPTMEKLDVAMTEAGSLNSNSADGLLGATYSS